jgi:hypothetical protein
MAQFNDTIGNYSNVIGLLDKGEYLSIGFQPNSVSLKKRWRNNGLSADFMADYVTTFFPQQENNPESISRQAEIKSAVSFIANELIENGMKYSDSTMAKPINISLILEEHKIIIVESNVAGIVQATKYRDFVLKLSQTDPMEMYLEQLEIKAMTDDNISGLGLLTMLNDYEATLGWHFETLEAGLITISTEVYLPI